MQHQHIVQIVQQETKKGYVWFQAYVECDVVWKLSTSRVHFKGSTIFWTFFGFFIITTVRTKKSIWIPPTSPFSLLSVSFYDREREMGITIMCVAYPAKVCTLYGKYFTSTLHYSLYNNDILNLKSDNILTYFLHSLKCRLIVIRIMIIIIFSHLNLYLFCNTWI